MRDGWPVHGSDGRQNHVMYNRVSTGGKKMDTSLSEVPEARVCMTGLTKGSFKYDAHTNGTKPCQDEPNTLQYYLTNITSQAILKLGNVTLSTEDEVLTRTQSIPCYCAKTPKAPSLTELHCVASIKGFAGRLCISACVCVREAPKKIIK